MGHSAIEKLMGAKNSPVGLSVLLTLAWVAGSDGDFDLAEVKRISEMAREAGFEDVVGPLIRIVRRREVDSLKAAVTVIRQNFRGERARRFLALAIGIAAADGKFRPSENHLLRFLADLLGIDQPTFEKMFFSETGLSLPAPSDLSDARFWRSTHEQRKGREGDAASSKSGRRGNTTTNAKLAESYAVLGLEVGASRQEITKAFRRLAQLHHPDRFISLGDEAVAAASVIFRRIREAYEYLTNHA